MHTELARWPSFSHKPTGEVSQGDAYSYASFDALAQRYTPFGVPARKTLWSQVPSKVAASLLGWVGRVFQSPLWGLPRRFSPKLPTDKDWMLNRQQNLQALKHDCVQIGSPKETQNHDHATNEDFAECEKLQNERQCALTQIALMLG